MRGDFDVRDFRNALGTFVTGVTIVTTQRGGKPVGFTANSFTSVSLDPPLILACIGKSSSNFEAFSDAESFCVNILGEHQSAVSQKFSAKGVDRFAGVEWARGSLGSPIIDASLAWFQCSFHERVDAGDHVLLIGRVHDYGHTMGTPLGYCRGNYILFELEQQLVAARNQRGRFGAIVETQEGILLVPGEEPGTWSLPTAIRLGTKASRQGLFGLLISLGLEFELEFLFSVWEGDAGEPLNVFYRGTGTGKPADGHGKIFAAGQIPFHVLRYEDQQLLKRYIDERLNARFSVYNGTFSQGTWWRTP
ncbi:flavin reductase family protein [Aminobacter sp. MSH1]|uniref:flavin reductase family protein n=1 Tax=Aminobacter sp. MSH1 TaxID=374606 RepID=UPI000D34C949|nr:flavin reductase family protein [Aminobacter sp. MSH1]